MNTCHPGGWRIGTSYFGNGTFAVTSRRGGTLIRAIGQMSPELERKERSGRKQKRGSQQSRDETVSPVTAEGLQPTSAEGKRSAGEKGAQCWALVFFSIQRTGVGRLV